MNAAPMQGAPRRGISLVRMIIVMLVIAGGAAALMFTRTGPPRAVPGGPAAPPTGPAAPARPAPPDAGAIPPVRDGAPPRQADRIAEVVAGAIAKAHGSAFWQQRAALQTDIRIELADAVILEGTLTFEAMGHRARLETKAGAIAIFDGEKAWLAGRAESTALPDAKFQLRAWPELIAAPFRLSAPGTRASEYQTRYMDGAAYDSLKLTLPANADDAAGGWRRIYAQQRSHLLYAIGNISMPPSPPTAGGGEAGEGGGTPQSRAIVFSDYQLIEGVQIATTWTLRDFADSLGLKGDPLGRATLTNLHSLTPAADAFAPPEGAREIQ